MIRPELLRESLAVQEWLEEGRAEGLEKGAQDSLLAFLSARFPALPVPEGIHSITSKPELDRLIRQVGAAKNAKAALRAIEQAINHDSH